MTITQIEMAHLSVATDFYAHAARANDLYVAAALKGLLGNPEVIKTLGQAKANRVKLVEVAILLGKEVMNRRRAGNNEPPS
jgi:hypothetical protein